MSENIGIWNSAGPVQTRMAGIVTFGMMAVVGTALACLAIVFIAATEEANTSTPWLIAGAAAYLLGPLGITGLFNVPLNNRLDNASATEAADDIDASEPNGAAPSIAKAGLDPNDLPESDPSAMNFGSGGNQEAKAWKDIWGCGQGIGPIDKVQGAGDYVDQLAREYEAAKAALL